MCVCVCVCVCVCLIRHLQDFDAAEIERLRGEGVDGAVLRAMAEQAEERLMQVCLPCDCCNVTCVGCGLMFFGCDVACVGFGVICNGYVVMCDGCDVICDF